MLITLILLPHLQLLKSVQSSSDGDLTWLDAASYLLGEGGRRLGGVYMWEVYGRGRARAGLV